MGLHIILLAKLKLLSNSRTVLSPLAAGLLWTFVLKLGCSFSFVRKAYGDMLYASRLFFFQLDQIVSDNGEPGDGGSGAGTRLERAVRLVCERLVHARRSPSEQLSDEESLHALSMLAL